MATESPLTPAEYRKFLLGISLWAALLVVPPILFGWQEKIEQERRERLERNFR